MKPSSFQRSSQRPPAARPVLRGVWDGEFLQAHMPLPLMVGCGITVPAGQPVPPTANPMLPPSGGPGRSLMARLLFLIDVHVQCCFPLDSALRVPVLQAVRSLGTHAQAPGPHHHVCSQSHVCSSLPAPAHNEVCPDSLLGETVWSGGVFVLCPHMERFRTIPHTHHIAHASWAQILS